MRQYNGWPPLKDYAYDPMISPPSEPPEDEEDEMNLPEPEEELDPETHRILLVSVFLGAIAAFLLTK